MIRRRVAHGEAVRAIARTLGVSRETLRQRLDGDPDDGADDEGGRPAPALSDLACRDAATGASPRGDAVKVVSGIPFGGPDCALPMIYATEKSMAVDAFLEFTDNETWAGNIHPAQALRKYRQQSGIAAKCVVLGMTATASSIADPNDAGMLDVVGLDTSVPQLMADFIAS